MVFNLRKTLMSLLLAAFLLPAVAFANTEFKGTETVNINRADAATLAAYLKGIGANKAKAIVNYRKKNGKFKSIEDLKSVPGVGEETFQDNKRKMSTSRGKSSAPEGYKLDKSSGKSKSSSKKSSSKTAADKKSSSKKSTASSKDKDSSKAAKSSSKKSSSTSSKKSTSKKTSKKKSSKSSKDVKKSKKKKSTKKSKEKAKKSK